ncbi:PDDEXK nuclease domain-containing protein [Frisingicoccus sp.]|uniref:PDDEXK nuclease domain-containing protein n=1 Tax=Frisingicoccus sp. TaxID=1918627 RepID=UPI003AB87F14
MEERLTIEMDDFTEEKLDNLCKNAVELINYSRSVVLKEVNLIQLMTYFTLGKWIVEVQQDGESRAQYGKKVLITLSETLNREFGKGFSVATLTNIRKFYLTYQDRISEPVVTEFAIEKSQPLVTKLKSKPPFHLSWSHYLILMRIENMEERNFYERQAWKEGWGKRELGRQYGSSLYERLLIGKDKDKILETSQKGQIIEKPGDIVKDPYVLEFLGLDERTDFSESELESRLIDHLQEFLLELGTGFAFVARQKRFSFEEDHFRVDLVFYNRLLQCFVLFDLKTEKLKHQDLGQMQMYVNYYDRYEKQDFENPTIGVLMCPDKNDAMVELTLPENSNIYASKYQLYLPDKKLLRDKLKEWMEEAEGEF